MTYEEAVEMCNMLFDEYLPKVAASTRRDFIDAMISEFENADALELEDGVPLAEDDEDDV